MPSPLGPPVSRPANRKGGSGEKGVAGRMRNRLSKQVKIDIGAFDFWSGIWFRRHFAEIARVLGQGLRPQ
ncbi:MAG: hypothetical protein IH960_01475 [Chloroflexi bacterium]|nr:hypothetical protein [Chloroflexota bacterium]MCH8910339.1 hypothetical protein [Chloroflexota bacterium]